MKHYSYFILLLFTLAYPLFKSFEPKIQFHKTWKQLFPAIVITAIIFIAGDMWFVSKGIWWFDNDYVIGIYIFNLPIEECLFFFIIPFSSMFIYEVINYFIKKNISQKTTKIITTVILIFLLSSAIIFYDRFYTLIIFIFLSILLFLHQFIFKSIYLSRFYQLWTILIIPFLIFDGIVTAFPIVIYNHLYITGFRLTSIPIEDLFYGALQTLVIISIYKILSYKST